MSGIVGQNLGRGSGLIKAGAVDDNSITLAKMAGGTDGNIISYDASGDPTAIATGDDGQVLTSAGAGQPPAFETLSAGGDLSFGGDTFGADKTIGSNDTYALSFETDGNEAMKIDTAGHITLPLQSMFVSHVTSIVSNVTGDETTYSFVCDSDIIDRNADHDVSNGTFTAPVTGVYCFWQAMLIQGIASNHTRLMLIDVTSNRSIYPWTSLSYDLAAGGGTYITCNTCVTVDMDAGDTHVFNVRIDGGSKVIDVGDVSRYGGWLIG